MGCCLDFEASKQIIEETVQVYHPSDYKIFAAHRTAGDGIEYKVTVGVVVMPDVAKNTQLFEAFMKLHSRTDVCVKVLTSQIDQREGKIVDLFLLEITTEVTL